MIGFIDTYSPKLGTTSNTALSLVYTLSIYSCTPTRISSLVVSWQRIYNRLTITSDHISSLLSQPNSLLAIILQLQIPKTRPLSIPSSYPGRPESGNSTLHFTRLVFCESESESYVTTDGQSASLSWYKAPIRGLRSDFFPFGIRNTSDSYVLDSVGRPL
jgi:hypothetical protein